MDSFGFVRIAAEAIRGVACKQALPLKMARGRNIRAWLPSPYISTARHFQLTKPLYFDRAPFSTEEPACRLLEAHQAIISFTLST